MRRKADVPSPYDAQNRAKAVATYTIGIRRESYEHAKDANRDDAAPWLPPNATQLTTARTSCTAGMLVSSVLGGSVAAAAATKSSLRKHRSATREQTPVPT